MVARLADSRVDWMDKKMVAPLADLMVDRRE